MVEAITPEETARRLGSRPPGILLLDVRESDEREAAVIEPSLHIRMDEIADRVSELPSDRPIVVYCHHGSRSMMVAAFLEAKGFAGVANLTGGIDAWSRKVDPAVPVYV